MLESLKIQNLAIAEDLEVRFGPGLNVITGETGAGKSLLVQALNLVLGERADKTLIRSGESRCIVEATFSLPAPDDVNAHLETLDVEPCEAGRLIVRRIVSATGSGRSFINDCPTTVAALRDTGNLLVDLHGPHDHQSLFNCDFQLAVLDAFGQTGKLVAAYRKPYKARLALEQKRRDLEADDGDTERQLDMLAFQIQEITDADLTNADENGLEEELMRVANASHIVELASAACNALTENEASGFSALVAAQQSIRELAELMGDEAATWRDEIESLSIQVQELSATISGAGQSIDSDPARLQWLEDRKALVNKLKRKYGATITDILAFQQEAEQRHTELSTRGERLAEITAEVATRDADLRKAGATLTKARSKTAGKLAKAITAELQSLGFAQGAFSVDLSDTADPLPTGLDEVEFGFAPNVGEDMRPLRSIASSGEISRVMLATKAALAEHDRIPVLVFDEIDANLGGTTGQDVGAKLAAVAGSHQVLCITHLPQVAVHGPSHFVVAKHVEEGRTRTTIARAEGKKRVEEVARMLGGRDLTTVTLKHAEEMLAM